MKNRLLAMLALTVFGCANDDVSTSTDLNGKWVEITKGTDTLTFGLFGDKQSMILARGKEMKNGFLLPKKKSGVYDYEMSTDDTISLRWTLSSNSAFHDYYFRQTGGRLTVGNFFESPSGELLMFRKLK